MTLEISRTAAFALVHYADRGAWPTSFRHYRRWALMKGGLVGQPTNNPAEYVPLPWVLDWVRANRAAIAILPTRKTKIVVAHPGNKV